MDRRRKRVEHVGIGVRRKEGNDEGMEEEREERGNAEGGGEKSRGKEGEIEGARLSAERWRGVCGQWDVHE